MKTFIFLSGNERFQNHPVHPRLGSTGLVKVNTVGWYGHILRDSDTVLKSVRFCRGWKKKARLTKDMKNQVEEAKKIALPKEDAIDSKKGVVLFMTLRET